MRKLFFWMPLVLVGSLVYWTLAVTLGGMSLWAVWPSTETGERDIYQPISVKLVESSPLNDFFDCNEAPPEGASGAGAEVSGPAQGPAQGPGNTAF